MGKVGIVVSGGARTMLKRGADREIRVLVCCAPGFGLEASQGGPGESHCVPQSAAKRILQEWSTAHFLGAECPPKDQILQKSANTRAASRGVNRRVPKCASA